jgi:hypothetical protein
VRALLLPLFARSAWAQAERVVAYTKGEGVALTYVRSVAVGSTSHCVGGHDNEGAALATVRSIGVGPAGHCGGVHDRRGRFSGLCSLDRRGRIQALWWRALQLSALLWPLFARSAWAQPANVVAGTTRECTALGSVRSVGVDSNRHYVGGHDS